MKNRSIELNMFYGASPQIIEKAAQLRKCMTPEEEIVWDFLHKKKVTGLRFRRQHPIYLFIVDFYCHSIKLVIEVDGGYHNRSEQKEYDLGRTAELEEFKIKVLRFSNEQILNDFNSVKHEIIKECVQRRNESELSPQTPKRA